MTYAAARARGFGDFDLSCRVERFSDDVRCGERLGAGAGAEITAGAGDTQPGDAHGEQRTYRNVHAIGACGIMRIGSGHRVVGKRQISRVAGERAEMIETGHERKAAGT
jgi:hypothetical protein